MQELIDDGRGRASRRNRRAQEAGADLPHPQRASEAQRPDVRRGDARNPARRLRLPPQPRLPLPVLPGRHLRVAQPDPPLRPPQRQHRRRHDPPAEGKRTLLRAPARRSDQRRRPEPALAKNLLRRSEARPSGQPDRAGDEPRRNRNARGRHDRPDRLRPARSDCQPAARRQDDPAAKDGQERPHELSGRVRHHAADRRAARRSDRHGAADQRPELRSHQLHLRRNLRPPRAGERDGHRKGQANGRVRPGRA